MSKPRRIAVSYSRFSDPTQAKGDSADRQARMFRDFCVRHNLTPLKDAYIDRGRSGYHDEHRKKGWLGELIALARAGHFEPGTVVVVEAWDRLGRLRPDKQTELLGELLRTGVSVGVCRLDDVFTEEDFGTHKWTTLAVFVQLAFQESKQKAERVSASYGERLQRARKRVAMPPRRADGRVSRLLTDRLPYWLEPHGDYCREIPERAAAVKRIFELAAEGYGRQRIIAQLIAEKVPPFGKGDRWARTSVNRILSDRRVVGEYQPRRTDDTPDGAVLPNYYPAVITEEEWLLARAGQEKRQSGGKTVRSERRHVNVFRGLLTDALDGEGYCLQFQSAGGKRRLVLRNNAGHAGHARNVTFPYPVFEEAVLGLLAEVNPEDVLPREAGPSRATVLHAKLQGIRDDVSKLQEELQSGFSKALAAVLRKKEAEEEEADDDYQGELARSARPAESAWRDLPGLVQLVREGGDDARLRLRTVLLRLVADARVLVVRRGSWQLCGLQVYFTSGVTRSYLIANQSAGNGRRGGWQAKSFAAAGLPGTLDLRNRGHATRLEKALLAVTI
jgi:DNA invertase Pin-like site-specific DNA recombinase